MRGLSATILGLSNVLMVFAAIVITTVGDATVAQAVDSGALGIRPATEPDFFHLSLHPGAATDATAVIANHTATAVTLLTYTADGTTTPQGGFGLSAQHDPQLGVGAWAQPAADHVVVAADSEVSLNFHLAVPPGTAPGDYTGGLLIQTPEQAGEPAVGGQATVQLNVVQRQGVRVYLHVDGTAIPSLSAGPLTAQHTGNGVDFAMTVTNTGNINLHPTTALDLASTVGTDAHVALSAPDLLLPGASVTLRTSLASVPLVDRLQAAATVHSEAGTTTSHTSLTYAPPALIAGAGLLLTLLLLGAHRAVRFLRRARFALAAQAALESAAR